MTERDEKGRFVKGNPGNPKGRPTKAREEQYRDILITTVTPEAWGRIVSKAMRQAEQGNAAARKWLSDHLLGLPQQKVELTGKDGGAIEVNDARETILRKLARIAADTSEE